MKTFKLDIVTPTRSFYSGKAVHVFLPGSDGYFGVLTNHAPMLAVLVTGEGSYREGGDERMFVLTGGYAEILQDRTIVAARTAEYPEEIDIARAEEARERALKRLQENNNPEIDIHRAKASLMRALKRLRVTGN